MEFINNRLTNIEKNISRLDEKLDFSLSLQRNHLIRIKNGEELDDNMILMGRPYNDLSPLQAYSIYKGTNSDFIILDITEKNFNPPFTLEGTIHIPFSQLGREYIKIPSNTVPLLVISEDGLTSIQACELLVRKGYFNVNNISGGYKYFPEDRENKPLQDLDT